MLIAKYTTTSSGLTPVFNEGYAYELTETVNEKGHYVIELHSDSDFNSCSFSSRPVVSIEYLKVTSKVTDMSYMFRASNLESINIEGWDTSNVTNMSYMFARCSNLKSLDLNSLNTSNVTDMTYMFEECNYLETLNISNWDTKNVRTMPGIFRKCVNLTELNIKNWNVSNVTDMSQLFYFCELLTSIDLSGWDVSSVTSMTYLFYYCSNLTEINLSNWHLDNCTPSRTFFGIYYDMFNEANITMKNSDYASINKIITDMPRIQNPSTVAVLNIAGVDNLELVNTANIESRGWTLITEEPAVNTPSNFRFKIMVEDHLVKPVFPK